MLHRRLRQLPTSPVGDDGVVLHAETFRSRLMGLALVRPSELSEGHAVLLEPCSSVHTFGMRFPVDVAFADADGAVLRVIRGLAPRRIVRCPKARVALEAQAGELDRFLLDDRAAGARLAVRTSA
jgi:uncharacterized protein